MIHLAAGRFHPVDNGRLTLAGRIFFQSSPARSAINWAWSRRMRAGRQGLPSEAVLRCALLKQYRQLSLYEESQCGTVVRVTILLSVGCCGIHGLSPNT
ncbi:hypothetical protein GHK80_17665 [Sinorhizobium medicae]|nr:hypothetical protein [Sinorhizobium medicae]